MADLRSAPKSERERKLFKYPAEEETFVRRLGAALLTNWAELPPDIRAKLQADALTVWDREYNVPQLAAKLDTFIRRFPARLG